jgi:hypothetical protein
MARATSWGTASKCKPHILACDRISTEPRPRSGQHGDLSREVHVAFLSAEARKVSDRGSFRYHGELGPHFKGRIQIRHLAVRILSGQPASAVSAVHFRLAKKCPALPPLRPVTARLCGRKVARIQRSRSSLSGGQPRIFDIRIFYRRFAIGLAGNRGILTDVGGDKARAAARDFIGRCNCADARRDRVSSTGRIGPAAAWCRAGTSAGR